MQEKGRCRKWGWVMGLLLIAMAGEAARIWITARNTSCACTSEGTQLEKLEAPMITATIVGTTTLAPKNLQDVATTQKPTTTMDPFHAQAIKDYRAALRILYGPDSAHDFDKSVKPPAGPTWQTTSERSVIKVI